MTKMEVRKYTLCYHCSRTKSIGPLDPIVGKLILLQKLPVQAHIEDDVADAVDEG